MEKVASGRKRVAAAAAGADAAPVSYTMALAIRTQVAWIEPV